MARIEEYHRMKHELKKMREVREMLQAAAHDDEGYLTQKRLMKSSQELEHILDHLDADQITANEHGSFKKMWFMEKMGNISGSVDGLVQKLVREDLGHDDISWSNIE